MLDEFEYSQGVAPEPSWAMGLRLNPLTIGHLLILRAQRSPFLGYRDHAISYGKLRTAILVLAHDYDGAIEALSSPGRAAFLRLWHWRASCFGLRRVDVQGEANRVLDHIWGAYRNRPVFLPNSEAEGPGIEDTPAEWTLCVHLMRTLHMSWQEAVNCPWSRAFWLHGAVAEMMGAGGLATQEGLVRAKAEADEAHSKIAELIAKGVIRK